VTEGELGESTSREYTDHPLEKTYRHKQAGAQGPRLKRPSE
jgi:hypothetical protein